MDSTEVVVPKKTRASKNGRKEPVETPTSTVVPKKTRKTKSTAKLVETEDPIEPVQIVNNVILHLKCTTADLEEHDMLMTRRLIDPLKYNPDVPPEVETYDIIKLNACEYDTTCRTASTLTTESGYLRPDFTKTINPLCCKCKTNEWQDDVEDTDAEKRELKQKLRDLKVQLYKNSVDCNKKSACFWDTCEYDNPACRIPLYIMGDTIHGYGSFCRPECAVAYLFQENIDDSTKFERYQLINRIYGPIYNYKKNIKPAPSPYYTLDKYYGDLSIQEYRRLLKSEHLLMVVEKPFTRVLPELHEDNDELMTNVYGINKASASTGGIFKVKRQSERPVGPSKSSVIADKFTK